MGAVLFVVGLVAVILVHELGHLTFGRRFGARADRFFVGFGPTLWSRHVGEVQVGVKAVPLGGFVRLTRMRPGDDPDPSPLHQAFDTGRFDGGYRSEAGLSDRDLASLLRRRRTLAVRARSRMPDVFDGAGEHVAGTVARLWALLVERGLPDLAADEVVAALSDDVAASRLDVTTFDADVHGEPDEHVYRRYVAAVTPVAGRLDASRRFPTAPSGTFVHRLTVGDVDRGFVGLSFPRKAAVLVAGPATHFVVAFVALTAAAAAVGAPTATTVVESLNDDAPAARAGLQPGDRIVDVGGHPVAGDATLTVGAALDRLQTGEPQPGVAGAPVQVTFERDGRTRNVTVAPVGADGGRWLLGFVPRLDRRPVSLTQAAADSWSGPSGVATTTVAVARSSTRLLSPDLLGQLASRASGQPAADGQEGPASLVGATSLASDSYDAAGVWPLLQLFALINVILGVFNLLPLPPLDGGHLLVSSVEAGVNRVRSVVGQSDTWWVPENVQVMATLMVLSWFGLLTVLSFAADIQAM